MSTLPVTATVTAPAVPELSSTTLAKLAREVVMNIREIKSIVRDYGITEQQYTDHICVNEFYKRTLESLAIEWNSTLTTHQRIKLQAAAGLEEALPSLAARMTKNDEPLPAAVETGKLFAKIAGIGEERGSRDSAEKFVINISLAGDTKLSFEKDITPTAPAESKDIAVEEAVQSITKG